MSVKKPGRFPREDKTLFMFDICKNLAGNIIPFNTEL